VLSGVLTSVPAKYLGWGVRFIPGEEPPVPIGLNAKRIQRTKRGLWKKTVFPHTEIEPRFLYCPSCSLITISIDPPWHLNNDKIINKKFWEKLIAYFPLTLHGSH
jgi:hypothetical protein